MINLVFYSFSVVILTFLILKFLISETACFLFPSCGVRQYLSMGSHQKKKYIPKYGGIVFFLAPIILIFRFGLNCQVVFIALSSCFSGLIGLWDDIVKSKNGKGIAASQKFFSQAFFAILAICYVYFFDSNFYSKVYFFGYNLEFGFLYIFWGAFVSMASAHAVNLTDGIDGLATSQIIIILFGLRSVFFYNLSSVSIWAISLISVILLIFFLFFNKNPAKIFMGDVGSLFLGGYIASIFLYEKKESYLPIIGAFIVLETVSVILQYLSFRFFKRRIFLCAPFHHDLEKRGVAEKTIVFWSCFFSYIMIGIAFFVKKIAVNIDL